VALTDSMTMPSLIFTETIMLMPLGHLRVLDRQQAMAAYVNRQK